MPGPLSSLLVTAFAASVVEAAVGADGEVAVGRAPIALVGPEENSLAFTLVPGAGLQLRSTSTTLALSYTPRIFYRLPNALGVDRPLVLHKVALAEQSELSNTAAWSSSAQLSVGQVDYTAVGAVFDPNVSSAVRSSVADIFRVEGQSGLTFDTSSRVRLSWEVSGDYTKPLDEAPVLPPTDPGMPETPPDLAVIGDAVPESAQLSTLASLSYEVSRYDRVATAGQVTYQWFPDTGRYLLFSPDVSWDTQLNRRTTLGVSAGFAYVVTLEASEGVDDSNSIGGTGSFRLGSVVHKSRNVRVSSLVNTSLDWFFDPLAGTSRPRAGIEVSSTIEIGRSWLITPNAAFYTLLSGERARIEGSGTEEAPTVPTDDTFPDATLLRAELPFRYIISRDVSITFGGRTALRGRPLYDENFRLNEQVELWAFVGLTVRLATSQEEASWLPL